MRSPVLIAETPFAGGHGPRFLAPPGRQVDADTAAFYLANALEGDDDAEEIEGDDYLAVRMSLTDDSTGDVAPQMLLLAGVDVDRMSGEERDEVLDQLRERLEVLNDAILAIDWQKHEYDTIIEIPELDEWHEASWDALPRVGRWADPSQTPDAPNLADHSEPEPTGAAIDPPSSEDETWGEDEQRAESVAETTDPQPDSYFSGSSETWPPEPEPERASGNDRESEPEAASEGDESNSPVSIPMTVDISSRDSMEDDAAPTSHSSEEISTRELDQRAEQAASEQEQSAPVDEPPVILEMPLVAGKQQPQPTGPVTVIVQVVADPSKISPAETEPSPDLIVSAKEPAPAAPSSSGAIDPVQVSASIDRSPALAPLPVPSESTPTRRRGLRWWVWFPWTAVVVLLTAKYLYLTQLDRTWRQRVTESHYAAGPIKLIEKPVESVVVKEVEKPVERIVEKTVEKPIGVPIHVPIFYPIQIAGPAAPTPKADALSQFDAEYRSRIAHLDLVSAADLISANQMKLTPQELGKVREEYQNNISARLKEWTTNRINIRRFADAYAGLSDFATAKSVKEVLGDSMPSKLAQESRTSVRDAEDQYHYRAIQKLTSIDKVDDTLLNHHVNAYLSIVEPSGVMLGVVQKLAEYRQWLKDGQPMKAIVAVEWGPRTLACEHTLEIGFGMGKDGQPLKSFIRNAVAGPGKTWTDTFAISGFSGNIPYRIKTTRPTSPVEELAESGKARTELFLSDPAGPLTVANEVESGTKVRVDSLGAVVRPELPEWGGFKVPPTTSPTLLPKE